MLVPFFVILFILFASSNTYAAQPSVVLNEVYPPTNSEDWVELYNDSSSEVDISRWKLLDLATTPMKTIPDNTKITPKSFLVVAVSNRLNASGDTVKLVDQNGVEIDSFGYNSVEVNKSFARLPDGKGDWFGGQTPTKEAPNGSNPPQEGVAPAQTSSNITLTEFMPDPASGSEWAEVYNPESFEADISGWKIDDIEGASSPYPIPQGTKIGPKNYLVFSFSSKLNNSGDSIRLLNPKGEVVETYSYKETVKGASFAKDAQGGWQITITPTPGAPNKITQPTSGKTSSSKKAAAKGSSQTQTNNPVDSTSPNLVVGNYNLDSNLSEAGTVAGATNQKQANSGLAILLIAAGTSFLFAAASYPLLEKRLWKKESSVRNIFRKLLPRQNSSRGI